MAKDLEMIEAGAPETIIEKKSGKKDILLKIRNLKQYFPVKGSRYDFVKANDGISLDIYKNETLGIVGESGCGKSTLGRTILQLYEQTDGETIYYGITRDEITPNYLLKTYRDLSDNIQASKKLLETADKLEKELEDLIVKTDEKNPGEAETLKEKQLHYDDARKLANNTFLHVVELIGGFYALSDPREIEKIEKAYMAHYTEAKKLVDLNRELGGVVLDQKDLYIRGEEATAKGKNSEKFTQKAKGLLVDIKDLEQKIKAQKETLAQKNNDIIKWKKTYAEREGFLKYEAMADTGVNLARLEYKEMRKLRKDMQLIFQDPYSSLNPRFTVGQIVGEGLITHNFYKRNNTKSQDYIMNVMENCGLQSYMIHRYPHQFSGGQRQRIGIARSLAVAPKFVVCDEAVSALDVSIQSQVINLLKDLKDKDQLTYMFISHDLSVVKYISDRIAVMYLGNVVELATTAALFENALHPYTEALLSAIPTTDSKNLSEQQILEGDIPSPIDPPSGCKFHTRCPNAQDLCKLIIPALKDWGEDHFVACLFPKDKRQPRSI